MLFFVVLQKKTVFLASYQFHDPLQAIESYELANYLNYTFF